MEHNVCWICGAGEFTPRLLRPAPGDLIVAADGGLSPLSERGIVPSFCLGDFDSLGYCPRGEHVAAYPPEKDDTDMLLAVKYGLSKGCKTFFLYGALGGRLSHTLANLQVLYYLRTEGCHGFLIGPDSIAAVVGEETAVFDESCAGMLSVLAYGGAAEGVTIWGLKYEAEDVALTSAYPIGVSNEFTGRRAAVSVRAGALVLIWEHADADFSKITFSGP